MNQTQLKHALGRAAAILKLRTERLKVAHTVPAVKLSTQERLQALRDGAFTVVDVPPGSYRAYLSDFLAFNAERDEAFDKDAHDAALAELTKAYNTLVDELVLGDNQTALVLLRAFEDA